MYAIVVSQGNCLLPMMVEITLSDVGRHFLVQNSAHVIKHGGMQTIAVVIDAIMKRTET